MVLLASLYTDLQHALGRFAAECEVAEMRISTVSKAMVIDWKRVKCPLHVGKELLPQVKEFKHHGVLFISDGKAEQEMDRQIVVVYMVMWAPLQSVVVKRELSCKQSSQFTSPSMLQPLPMVMNCA